MPPRSGRETSARTVCAPEHPYPVSGCNGGGAGGDSGTAALEVREREAHITATVRSAMCVCDAVSVERF
eukprot:2813329-Prymnesium_polylepis.1